MTNTTPETARTAGIYVRVSSAEQAADGTTSIENQENRARAYAEAQGWTVSEVFVDPGVSGSIPLEERPAGRRLILAVDRGEIDAVVVLKVDRFSRAIGGSEILRGWRDRDIAFAAVVESFDTSTPAGRMMLNLLLTFAEFERDRIAERMEDGRTEKARLGLWSGGQPPLGWTAHDGKLVIDDTEADTVRRLFALTVAEGFTPAGAAATLTAEGRKTKRGGAWRHSQVIEALGREAYAGAGLSKTHQGETFAIEAPAIISSEVFEAAQKVLAVRTRRLGGGGGERTPDGQKRPRGWRYGLAGRAFHLHEDGSLHPLYSETPKKVRRYRCGGRDVCVGFGAAPNGSTIKSIEARSLETVTLEALLGMLDDPSRLAEYQADYDAAAVAEYGGWDAVLGMKAKLVDLAERIAVEAKAVVISETLAGSTEAEASAAAKRAVTALQTEQAATAQALGRAENREAQRLSVKVTIDELMNATIGTQGPEGIDPTTPLYGEDDPTTELDEAREGLRYEIRKVHEAAKAGDRTADLSQAAVDWIRLLLDKLDLDLIVESGGPEGWTLTSAEDRPGIAAGFSSI